MSKKQIKNLMFVLQLLLDGKKVEFYNDITLEWREFCDEDELDSELEYREKPEPKVIWVNEYNNNRGVAAWIDKASAEKYHIWGASRIAVKYQEVL